MYARESTGHVSMALVAPAGALGSVSLLVHWYYVKGVLSALVRRCTAGPASGAWHVAKATVEG